MVHLENEIEGYEFGDLVEKISEKLSECLERLRAKAGQGLKASIDLIKELCQIARDTVKVEKELEQLVMEKTHKQPSQNYLWNLKLIIHQQ